MQDLLLIGLIIIGLSFLEACCLTFCATLILYQFYGFYLIFKHGAKKGFLIWQATGEKHLPPLAKFYDWAYGVNRERINLATKPGGP